MPTHEVVKLSEMTWSPQTFIPGEPLVVWCGTKACQGKGKSTLMRDLFFNHNNLIDVDDSESVGALL